MTSFFVVSTSLGGGWHEVPGEGFALTFADLHLPSLDFSNTRKLVLKNLSPQGEIVTVIPLKLLQQFQRY